MALTLHYHPLSSYCWKVLIALYEKGTSFERRIIDFSDPVSAAAFRALWPMAKMPVLVDGAQVIPESSIIIEYLDRLQPTRRMIPDDPDAAFAVRLADRFYDLSVQGPMQKIVGDRIRPEEKRDAYGVAEARAALAAACVEADRRLASSEWAAGGSFTLADCAAVPALFYADKLMPLAKPHPHAADYLEKARARPSVARVLEEAEPYLAMFPT